MAEFADFMDGITDAIDEEIQDAVILEEGEHELKLVSIKFRAKEEDEDNPNPRYNVGFEPVQNPDAELVWYTLWLPHSTQDGRKRRRANRDLKNFAEALGLGWPINLPLEEEDLKELTVYASVGTETYEGEVRNNIKAWVKAA